MKVNQIQTVLLGVVSQALTGKEYVPPADTDWAALFAESKAQAVSPLIFSCVSKRCADEEVFREWKEVTIRSMQRNRNIQVRHGELHQLLETHGIPYTIIKGCASARDYPDPLLRSMGDIDFLILPEHWEQTEKILIQEGFVVSGEEHPCHLSFHKKGFEMEMHRDPFGLTGEESKRLLDIVPYLVNNSVLVNCDDVSFRMPDSFGHGLVLLLHAYRHLIDTGIGVRHLCDWAMFISGFNEREFVEIFKERFQELGIWKLAQIFSTTAYKYLSIPYQEWMGEVNEEICQMLILDIFNGGNFGRGSGDRYTQNKSLYAQDKELTQNSGRIQLLRSLNQAAIMRYPRLMKIPVFRPFGWLILGLRYAFRVLTGRREKAPSDTMKMASMRKKLYQEFAVFKTK